MLLIVFPLFLASLTIIDSIQKLTKYYVCPSRAISTKLMNLRFMHLPGRLFATQKQTENEANVLHDVLNNALLLMLMYCFPSTAIYCGLIDFLKYPNTTLCSFHAYFAHFMSRWVFCMCYVWTKHNLTSLSLNISQKLHVHAFQALVPHTLTMTCGWNAETGKCSLMC